MNELEVEDREQKLKEMIDFINIIDNIMISKATVAKEDLVVYRGTVNKKEEQPYLGMNKGYISTSKSINAIEKNSYRFLNEAEGCCVYIYTIKRAFHISIYQKSVILENATKKTKKKYYYQED